MKVSQIRFFISEALPIIRYGKVLPQTLWMIWKMADPHTTKMNRPSNHGPTLRSSAFIDLMLPRCVTFFEWLSFWSRIRCLPDILSNRTYEAQRYQQPKAQLNCQCKLLSKFLQERRHVDVDRILLRVTVWRANRKATKTRTASMISENDDHRITIIIMIREWLRKWRMYNLWSSFSDDIIDTKYR